MELKEAIEIIEDLIDGNKERLSTVIHIYDRECIALNTVLQALENSIPKQVIEEKIKELKDMTLECETFSSMRNYAVLILQELLENK